VLQVKDLQQAMAFWCEADATSERRFRQAILAGISAGGAFLRHSGKWPRWPRPALCRTENGDGRSVDRYVALTEERNSTELKGGAAFLWPDTLAENERERHTNRCVQALLESKNGKRLAGATRFAARTD